MPLSDEQHANELRSMQVNLLENINTQLSDVSSKLNDTREMVIRLEAGDLPNRVKNIEERVGKTENRVTRVETRSAVIVAGLSVFISGIVSIFAGIFKGWFT